MKRFICDTWYGPVVVWCCAAGFLLGVLGLDAVLQYHMPEMLGRCLIWTAFILLAVATIFNLIVFIFAFVLQQWKRLFLQLIVGLVAIAAFIYGFFFLMVASMFGPSEDHFADDLTIPTEIVADIVEPGKEINVHFEAADIYDDDFSRAIFGAVKDKDDGSDPVVMCDLSALAELVHNRRDELMAYLARHPGWWLHEDRGNLCATRRLSVGGAWNHHLYGGYSGNTRKYYPKAKEDFDAYQKSTHFQVRTIIGFPYSPFGRKTGAEHSVVSTILVPLDKGSLDTKASRVCFGDKDFCVDVLEELPIRNRCITNAALKFLKDEFTAFKLPDNAAVRGPDEFVLRNAMQPGIYNLTLRINPGEAGIVYLKAFEVTRGTPLSEGRLYDSSNERVGWSGDPEEKFLYENEFTIYEGDWGKPYAALIEVWFRPDSGKSERKLMTRTCKIEGWQR